MLNRSADSTKKEMKTVTADVGEMKKDIAEMKTVTTEVGEMKKDIAEMKKETGEVKV